MRAHLSFSGVSRWERCPHSYELRYVRGLDSEPTPPLRLGKAVHAALEMAVRDGTGVEVAWIDASAAQSLDHTLHAEGLEMLRAWMDRGPVDPLTVLAVEARFELQAGAETVVGVIDRIDRDGDGLTVVDYKSNRALYTREELATSLQLSLYAAGARALFPGDGPVRLVFEMLRHGIRQETTRTEAQISAALHYVSTVGRAIDAAAERGEWPAVIGSHCAHCDYRRQCAAYASALASPDVGGPCPDLAAVADERARVAGLCAILDARKDELDATIKAELQTEPAVYGAGVVYTMGHSASKTVPLPAAVAVLARALGLEPDDVLARVGATDRHAVDALLAGLPKAERAAVKDALDSHADTVWSPRLVAKVVK
jgi:putative RecB family exonuclease